MNIDISETVCPLLIIYNTQNNICPFTSDNRVIELLCHKYWPILHFLFHHLSQVFENLSPKKVPLVKQARVFRSVKKNNMVGLKPTDLAPTATVKFFGAGTAACIADLVTFPLDTAKVRLQVRTGLTPKVNDWMNIETKKMLIHTWCPNHSCFVLTSHHVFMLFPDPGRVQSCWRSSRREISGCVWYYHHYGAHGGATESLQRAGGWTAATDELCFGPHRPLWLYEAVLHSRIWEWVLCYTHMAMMFCKSIQPPYQPGSKTDLIGIMSRKIPHNIQVRGGLGLI